MSVKKQHLSPDGLFSTRGLGFTHVVTSAPGVTVHVSGQTAWNAKRELVGGDDLGLQAEQALKNLQIALEAAGAAPSDVVSVRVYVVDYQPEFARVLGPLFDGFFSEGPPPASTWLGVSALAAPGFRIEIEASAVIAG
jgi:enamine deaminase RidA (YjgF/YER057c/UK114 family)